MLWHGYEIEQILGIKTNLELDVDWNCNGVSIDSRTLQKGDLFFALKIERDGHDFVADAIERGAAAAVVSRKIPNVSKQIIVSDTLQALKALAAAARDQCSGNFAAITGSVGKTSLKHYSEQVSQLFGRSFASEGNFNNHIGVPLSLAKLPKDSEFNIFEAGTSEPGKILSSTKQIKPQISIITKIAPGHLTGLLNETMIAQEKSDIFYGAKTAVLPLDSDYFTYLNGRAKAYGVEQVITVGTNPNADINLLEYNDNTVKISFFGTPLTYQLNILGEHQAYNTLFIFALAKVWGWDIETVLNAMPTLKPFPGRGGIIIDIKTNDKQIKLLDDSYNALPEAMNAGVLTLVRKPHNGRKIAVLGAMMELEDLSVKYHKELGDFLNTQKIDGVFACCPAMLDCYQQLDKEKQLGFAETAAELLPLVLSSLHDKDLIFVKGSKGSKVSIIAEALCDLQATGKFENQPG